MAFFSGSWTEVSVPMVVVADALLAQIPKKFDSSLRQNGFIGEIDSRFCRCHPDALRNAVCRCKPNSLGSVGRGRGDPTGEFLIRFLHKLYGRRPSFRESVKPLHLRQILAGFRADSHSCSGDPRRRSPQGNGRQEGPGPG